jgi:hypothetical protein
MPVRIEIPGEGVTVTATCGTCHHPLDTTNGSVSWICNNDACPIWQIPMWEDARFVDDEGVEWIYTDEGDWIDVAE